jgi:hypothetical protein
MLVDVIDNETGRRIDRRDDTRCQSKTVGRYTYCNGKMRRVVEWEVVRGRTEDMMIIWVAPRRTRKSWRSIKRVG